MHPVGPHSPRVYWVRRVIILVLAVVVLLGLVYLVMGRNSGTSATSGTSSSSSSSGPRTTGVLASTSRSSSASSSSSSEPTEPSEASESTEPPESTESSEPLAVSESVPSPEPAPSPSSEPSEPEPEPAPAETSAEPSPSEPPPAPVRQQDAQGRDLCFDTEISLTALADGPFVTGSQPVIGVRVQNTGAVTCTQDVSASLQVFTVLGADGSRIWSTADCFPGQGTEIRTLAPAETLEYEIRWSGTTSQPGCAGDRATVPPGDYQLLAAIGAIQSPPTAFTITG